ncbi:MAG: hypothetical protein IKF90_04230 [Parasporobacterium sp.]|nr:hypothetical protein [Parasporobacterium sp.]
MKITTFNPQIITNDEAPIVSLFQEFGFEERHTPEGIGELNVKGIRMKDANGFHLDISKPDISLPQDLVAIRINVDDFDEAYGILMKHGFKNIYGDNTVDTRTSRSAMMVSPSGFGINLVQHIKE